MQNPTPWLVAAMLLCGVAASQPLTNYLLSPSSSTSVMKPLDLGGGNTLYACQRKFGWDSTHVSLLFTAPEHALIDANAFRGHSPITFLFDAQPLSSGSILCGSQTSAGLTYPFLTRVSSVGAVEWSRSLDGLGAFNDQVSTIIPSGNSFMAYTKRSGILATGSYRIFGQADGLTWGGQAMTAPAGVVYNIYGGIGSDIDEHTLFGSGALSATNYDQQLMVMRTTLSGATWMKLYDMQPSASSQIETPFALVPISNGHMLLAGYLTTGATTYEGCLLKLASDGTVLWCRRYADSSGGLTVSAVAELPGGGLLAAGTDAYYQIMLLDLQPSGDLAGARRYQAPTVASDLIQGFYLNSAGDLKLIAADKVLELDGPDACDFVPVSSVTSDLHTPTVTTHTMGNQNYMPTTSLLNTHQRPNDLSWTPTCVQNGAREADGSTAVVAYPVPMQQILRLKGDVRSHERVVLRSSTGALHYSGPYGSGIDASRLGPGIYFLEVPEKGICLKAMKE